MADDSRSISVSPEFERLSRECEILKEELATLFAEWSYYTVTAIPYIEAEYVTKIGTLQYELMLIQVSIQRTKREIELIQAALNRGEIIDPDEVHRKLDREFAEWKAKLDTQLGEIEYAKLQLSSVLSAEDSTELRKLYRALAKKLHPDVNPDQSEDSRNLWLQVQSAYEIGDLKQLQALTLLADEIPENYDLPNSIDILRKKCGDLKDQVKNILQKLADLKKLPVFEWEKLLKDPKAITEEQLLINEQIAQLGDQLLALQTVLTGMKRGTKDE